MHNSSTIIFILILVFEGNPDPLNQSRGENGFIWRLKVIEGFFFFNVISAT